MAIAMRAIREALQAAGMLAGERGRVPETATGIADDSRALRPGGVFVAVRGSARDGHEFLPAVEGRAAAVIVEESAGTTVPALVVREGTSRRAAAVAAAAAYGEPARAIRAVAVTGTNGKTTSVGILRHLFDGPSGRAASIGTLGVLVGSAGEELPGGSGLTTPGPIELQRLLRELVDRGVATVAMETSSHSLDQRRVEGMRFDAALFTNLTRDHLDYHATMEAYFAAKARLIEYLAPDGVAVVNADDPHWQALPAAPRLVRFGVAGERADVRARDVRLSARGSSWTLYAGGRALPVTSPLVGDFNVTNALGAAAAAWALEMPLDEIVARLAVIPQVPGRLERIHEHPTVLRDYAHTPDALERALTAVRQVTSGRLLVLFGAGGDRDRGKRPSMGAAAERLADVVIVTSDNPRTEDPERILDDIETGMQRPHERIADRREAIARALALAGPEDVVVLAGKGPETYQIRGTTSYPFDERQIVHELTDGRSVPA
jgi:UDP-N-acetylmuramoyl-L-alanyl-D-glutamate--2,6-diaminopimelate ligase